MFESSENLQAAASLSFIDQNLASSFILNSPLEYKHWLLTLAQHLVETTHTARLKELLDFLLGPVYATEAWDSKILGQLSKRGLFEEVLNMMPTNTKLQRLYLEYKELLEAAKSVSRIT